MKILIIGGTSFFGKSLVTKLLEEKAHIIHILSRGNKKPKEFNGMVTYIKADRHKKTEFIGVVNGGMYDVVVDNRIMNEDDALTALQAFSQKVGHYIMCSSVAVYPKWDCMQDYREEDATLEKIRSNIKRIEIDYANGKIAAEKILLSKKGTFPFTIMRPAVIQGPNDPTNRTFYWPQMIKSEAEIKTPIQQVILNHVYVEDVAEAFRLVIHAKKPEGEAYNVVGDEKISLNLYIIKIAELLGARANIKTVSKLPENFPLFYDKSLLISNEKIKNTFGFSPTKLNSWLNLTIRCFLKERSIMDTRAKL